MAHKHRGGQFEVLHGIHTDHESGISYEGGEVVESPYDLDRMFADKFRRIGGKNRRPADLSDEPDEGGPRTGNRPLHVRKKLKAEAKKKKDLPPVGMKATAHGDRDFDEEDQEEFKKKKTARATARLVAEEDDDVPLNEDEMDDEVPDDEDAGTEGLEDDEAGEENEYGKDMSHQFADARKADLRVFKGDQGYHVVDADEPDKALNPKPLATKGAVETWVEDYTASDQGRKAKAEKKPKKTKR